MDVKSGMYAEERQLEIVKLARNLGRVSVADLVARYGVTSETIRRDLDALSSKGLLSRVHGGAVPVEKLRLAEASLRDRRDSWTEQKLAIAEHAVRLLPERSGLTVLIDAGTTTAKLAPLLPSSVSLVVTNSVPIAAELADVEDLQVFLLGGQVRGITQAAVGAETVAALGRLRVDAAFLGANGFSAAHGFSTPDPSEAAVKRAMVATSRQVFVLADASKFGVDHLVSFADLDDVDVLVTDSRLDEEAVKVLKQADLQVDVA